jgi:hypothetical protein
VEVLDQTWRLRPYIQGSGAFSWGSGLTGDTLEYVTFSGHVVVADPPMWWGQVLLLAQSSRPRLGRVMAWSHIQLFYHATKNSHVGTASLYSSKGYPSFRVPTHSFIINFVIQKVVTLEEIYNFSPPILTMYR